MHRTTEPSALGVWEARLAQAARSFADRLTSSPARGRELEATLLRLGFTPAETHALTSEPAAFCRARLVQIRARLCQELDALARRARSARFDYDLNRHIVVHRAAVRLDELTGQPRQPPSPAAKRPRNARRSSSTASRQSASIRR